MGKRSFKEILGIFIKRYLVTGIIIIIPLWLTYFVISILFSWVTSFTFPALNFFIPDKIWAQTLAKIISFFVSIACISLIGYFTNKVLGKSVLNYLERLIEKVPLIGTIYSAAKQFVNFLFGKNKNKSFKEVVFVPYPYKGVYSAAFKTGEQVVNGEKYTAVFMPTTPNPTTGFLLMFKEEDIVYTNYTVEQAFQFIISIGVINMDKKGDNTELHEKLETLKKDL